MTDNWRVKINDINEQITLLKHQRGEWLFQNKNCIDNLRDIAIYLGVPANNRFPYPVSEDNYFVRAWQLDEKVEVVYFRWQGEWLPDKNAFYLHESLVVSIGEYPKGTIVVRYKFDAPENEENRFIPGVWMQSITEKMLTTVDNKHAEWQYEEKARQLAQLEEWMLIGQPV